MEIKKCGGRWLLILSMGTPTTMLAANNTTPQSFTHQTRIELTGTGPFYQFIVPMAVYLGIERNDLGDLRVFNGQGEVLPHALLRPATTSVTQAKETPVPMFPIIGDQDPQEAMALEVRRNQDGTLVSLRTSTATPQRTGVVRGLVLDTSRIRGDIRSLHLKMGDVTTPFHALSVETSNDLQQWRLLKNDAQIVRLTHAGQHIEKTTLEWNSVADKYLRLLWRSPELAPAILSASVFTQHTALNHAPMIWSGGNALP